MKKIFPFAISIMIAFLLILSCSKDEPIDQHSLTVQIIPEDGGSVSPSSGSFDDGETITLLATPSAEYIFKNWSGGASGTSNPVSTIMNSNKAVTAVFEKKQYSLEIEIEGEGTVTEELLSAKSAIDFPSGSSVKLTAVPVDGWEFVEWSGDLTGVDNPVTISVDSPRNIKVKFQPVLYNQIIGKWDVNILSGKPSSNKSNSKNTDTNSSKTTDGDCIVYSLVFNSDGTFILSLASGEIQGTFYFDSVNSIALTNVGTVTNISITSGTIVFSLSLTNLCSIDADADNDSNYIEGECVSFLNCNDGNVWVKDVEKGFKYIRVTNDLESTWIEQYSFDTNWECISETMTNITSEYNIVLIENDIEQMTYRLEGTANGDVEVELIISDDNQLTVKNIYNSSNNIETDIYELSSEESLNGYLNSYANCLQRTYVPDDNFEQALIDYGYDDVLDDYVLTQNIENLTALELQERNINDATGIEGFVSLTTLYFHKNNLESIDLSKNTNLFILWIFENNLTSLDISSNLNLGYLFANHNNLNNIDVSKNLELVHIAIGANPLGTIDVSNNNKLVRLEVYNSNLESLNLDENIELVYLRFDNEPSLEDYQNKISSIDLSNNTELDVLLANNCGLISIDLSNNSKLTQLELTGTELTELNVSNLVNLEKFYVNNNQLTCIEVNENQLNNIPLGWIKDDIATYSLDCNNNHFIDDFNDCDISDYMYLGGNSIGVTESGLEGCGVYMTHYAGDELINFYHTDEEFDYGYYEVDALANNFISDNNIYLFQQEDMNGGMVLSFRPNNTDNPGFLAINLTSEEAVYESSTINVTQDQWYHIKLKVEPTLITVFINDEQMYSINTVGITVPDNGRWRFKLAVAYSGVFDNLEYSSF